MFVIINKILLVLYVVQYCFIV